MSICGLYMAETAAAATYTSTSLAMSFFFSPMPMTGSKPWFATASISLSGANWFRKTFASLKFPYSER